jgi:DNA replicative helicase MCM subunit Mcm2 (Cdc46/Mcm family)
MLPGWPHQPIPVGGGRLLALFAVLLLSACTPSNRTEEELRAELQALKAQVTAMQEKLNQVQGGQQAILELLKKPPPMAEPLALPGQLPAPEALTVAQLLSSKERYLGSRVKVKGMAGPVMVHHKSLILKSPQGMVEVLFGNLPDPKLIQTLSSATLDKPITVTGMVTLAPARGAGAQLQINAEAVEF